MRCTEPRRVLDQSGSTLDHKLLWLYAGKESGDSVNWTVTTETSIPIVSHYTYLNVFDTLNGLVEVARVLNAFSFMPMSGLRKWWCSFILEERNVLPFSLQTKASKMSTDPCRPAELQVCHWNFLKMKFVHNSLLTILSFAIRH